LPQESRVANRREAEVRGGSAMKRSRQRLLIAVVVVGLVGVGVVWLIGRQPPSVEEQSVPAQTSNRGTQEQASTAAATTGEIGTSDTRPAALGIEDVIGIDEIVEQEVRIAAEDVPRIDASRQKRINYVAGMSLEEVADNLGDRNVFPAFGRPEMNPIDFWARALPANIMVLRLIEEGREDPDRVCAILEKSLAKKIDELRMMVNRHGHGYAADPIAGQFAVAAAFYVLANIDRLDNPTLLARWIAMPEVDGYGKPYDLQWWFVDYYFRATEAGGTPYAAAHCAIVKDWPAPDQEHTRARWNQSWEVTDPWSELPGANVREPKRIEVLTIRFVAFTYDEAVRIQDNWQKYIKKLEDAS